MDKSLRVRLRTYHRPSRQRRNQCRLPHRQLLPHQLVLPRQQAREHYYLHVHPQCSISTHQVVKGAFVALDLSQVATIIVRPRLCNINKLKCPILFTRSCSVQKRPCEVIARLREADFRGPILPVGPCSNPRLRGRDTTNKRNSDGSLHALKNLSPTRRQTKNLLRESIDEECVVKAVLPT